jgi:hypothetical protein
MSELDLKQHWYGASTPVKVFVVIGVAFLAFKAVPVLSQVLTFVLFFVMLCIIFVSQGMGDEDADKLNEHIKEVYKIVKKNLLGKEVASDDQ